MAKTLQNPITELTLSSNSSLETQVFLAFRYRTPNRYKLIDKLTRANIAADEELTDKTIYLSEKSKKLLRAILKKFFRGETVLLNNKYITEVTRCKAGQNKNILAELENILDIKYYRLFKNNGVFFSYHYHFQLHPAILNELGLAGHKDIKSMAQFFVLSYINNKEAFNKSNRSKNVQAHESNLLKNSVSLDPAENIKQKAHSKVIPLKPKPISNKRKKPTNAKIKANKAKVSVQKETKAQVVRPVFYGKPKSLSDMHLLLDQSIFDELRSKSGREFSNNFIAQRVLAMSKKPKLDSRNFKTRNGFISYMACVLRNEQHDAVKTGSVDFRLLANITAADRAYQEQERFLTEIENSRTVTPEWHFKKKLVSVLDRSTAYVLLQSYKFLEVSEETLTIHLAKPMKLTELEKDIILDQAKATHERMKGDAIEIIEAVEFIMPEQETYANQINQPQQELVLPQGIWGGICKKLIAEFGIDIYKNWFSKLSANVDEVANTIELKASSSMVQEWVNNNYGESLAVMFVGAGLKFNEISV
jgi:hypothetical protein